MRIAILGGTDYLESEFEDWLYKLNAKHPSAVICTGTAGGRNLFGPDKEKLGYRNSAEGMAASLMPGLGHEVWKPDMSTKTAIYLGGGADLQLGWVLNGQWELYRLESGALQHRFITPRPDVIVAVGNPDSSRASAAHKHYKQFYAWREKEYQIPFVGVASPAPQRNVSKHKKARSRKQKNARESA